jgi:hypothetical protein
MSALSLTLFDLRGTLARIGIDSRIRQVVEKRADALVETLSEDDTPVEANVSGHGPNLSIELTGPNLRDREYGTSRQEGEARVTHALLNGGTR